MLYRTFFFVCSDVYRVMLNRSTMNLNYFTYVSLFSDVGPNSILFLLIILVS